MFAQWIKPNHWGKQRTADSLPNFIRIVKIQIKKYSPTLSQRKENHVPHWQLINLGTFLAYKNYIKNKSRFSD